VASETAIKNETRLYGALKPLFDLLENYAPSSLAAFALTTVGRFYKGKSQEKSFPHGWKVSCFPAPLNEQSVF